MKWHDKYPTPDYLQIRWIHWKDHYDDIYADFYDDIIEGSVFSKECSERRFCHIDVLGSRRISTVHYLLTVKGQTAILDYTPPAIQKANRRKNNVTGKAIIHFSDDSRTSVVSVDWQEQDGIIRKNDGRTSWDLPESLTGKFRLPGKAVQYKMTKKKVRFLQARFKSALFHSYKGACCISGCRVRELLDAAHILTATDEHSYDPRNGLLLRVDLHRLFDKGFLKINPNTRRVQLSAVLVNDAAYKLLDQTQLRPPSPFSYRPAKIALHEKWKAANKISQ